MFAQVCYVLSQYFNACTRLTDGRTDGRTFCSWLYGALHYMQSHGKND